MRFDATPSEPLASSPAFLLSWAGRRMAHEFAVALAPLELKPPHFGLLSLIDANPGVAQQDLVHLAMIDPSSMVSMLDELEQRGLAERRDHESDRRKHAIHLTAAGRRMLARARKADGELAERALAGLDDPERAQLTSILRKLAGVGR